MVKALKRDTTNPRYRTEGDFVNIKEFMRIPIERPDPLPQSMPNPIIRLEKNSPPADFFEVGSLEIVSQAFRAELEQAGAEIEYFDVTLLAKDGTPYQGGKYYYAHLLKAIDCLDLERSPHEFKYGIVCYIKKVVLREEALDDTPVFWVKNTDLARWFVSDAFAKHIESTKLRGMIFLQLDEIRT